MTIFPFITAAATYRGTFRRTHHTAAILLLAAVVAGSLQAQVAVPKQISGTAKSAPTVMVDRLAQEADVVAVGRVAQLQSEWNDDKSRIQTRVTLAVEQSIIGAEGAESITILVPGGEVEGVGELYTHSAQFQKNEEVLVFASKDAKGTLRVTSGASGKFLVEKDAKSGAMRVPNLGTVEELSARIKSSAKTRNTEPKRN